MDWVHTRRRGPDWKQKRGWGNWSLSSISAPPVPLLAIFTIVVSLLSLSQYVECREQMHHAAINLKALLFLVPVVLMIILTSSMASGKGWLNFRHSLMPRRELARGTPVTGFPWGVAAMLVVVLVLVSYRSSFQPKWFSVAGN